MIEEEIGLEIEEEDDIMAEMPEDIEAETEAAEAKEPKADIDFLKLAQQAHTQSESFIEASQTKRWRRNFSLAQSEHPDGSKYHTEAYQNRARHFRGKTEASIRKNEAAMAVAMFSNKDVLSLSATSDSIEGADAIVGAIHKICNHHLDSSVRWFMLALGAYHEAMIVGDVVSENHWLYERDESGEVLQDKVAIDLIPLENIKISPHASWLDPINSSPFVIIEEPMFIGDIKERMEVDWIKHTDTEIKSSAIKFKQNDIKAARHGKEQMSAEHASVSAVTDFDYVYVHKNFIREDGQDWFFYTLGKELMLSEPVPVSEAYPHLKRGRRPFTWGSVTIEPHKIYRRSMVDRVSSSQNLSNEIGNLRIDNVKQALNKRKYVQRYMGVDYQALKTSVPGGMVLMDDINAVKPEDTIDVTSSSYQEQAVVNSDFDELAGTFSASSVATNRQLNETVGGMQLLEGNANSLTEYQLRVFVETWVEPVIRDVVDMVVFYEDDTTIQAITGNQALTNESLQIPVKTRADVGFGSTDQNAKVQKLVYGINTVIQLPGVLQKLDVMETAREIFSVLGFNDGKKFLPDTGEQGDDPRIQQLMAELQKMQQIIQTEQIKVQANLQLEQMKAQAGLQLEQIRGKNSMAESVIKVTSERQVALTKMAMDRGIKLSELETKAGVDSGKLNLDYLKEINRRMDVANQTKELNFKMQTGQQGI